VLYGADDVEQWLDAQRATPVATAMASVRA
jgi:hypothetical protein